MRLKKQNDGQLCDRAHKYLPSVSAYSVASALQLEHL